MKAATIILSVLFTSEAIRQAPPAPHASKNCELHKTALKDGLADIHYGLMPPAYFRSPYMLAETKLFPQANSFVLGGCVVTEKKKMKVKFCPECRTVEAKWLKNHPKGK